MYRSESHPRFPPLPMHNAVNSQQQQHPLQLSSATRFFCVHFGVHNSLQCQGLVLATMGVEHKFLQNRSLYYQASKVISQRTYLRTVTLNCLWRPRSYKLHTHRRSHQTLGRRTADASTKNTLMIQISKYPDISKIRRVKTAKTTGQIEYSGYGV